MRHFNSVMVLLLGLSSVAFAEERLHVLFVLNPNRPETILRADATAVAREVQAAQEGDLLEGLDLGGVEVFRMDLRKGESRIFQMQRKNGAITAVRAYYLQVLQGKRSNNNTVDIPAVLKRTEDKIHFQGGFQATYLVLFASGIHRALNINFSGFIPSDSWIIRSGSPFASLRSLPVRALMVVDNQEFLGLPHQEGVTRFYTLLFARHGGTLVGFTTAHEQVRQIIGGNVTRPLLNNLRLENPEGDLILRRPPQVIQDPDSQ